MAAHEHGFRPREVYAPVDKTGGISNTPQLEPPQQKPSRVEIFPNNNQLDVLKPHTSALLGLSTKKIQSEVDWEQYENEDYIKAKLQKTRDWYEGLKGQGISLVDIPAKDAYKKLQEIEKETAEEFGLPWPPSYE
jgi:hypothetical protein